MKFVTKEIYPNIQELENHNYELVEHIMKKAGQLGLLGLNIPEKYGGFGMGFNLSMLILALSYTLFYMSYYKFFLDEKLSKIFIRISIIFVMVSMICFVLVAMFSAENATFQLHVFFVKIAFRSLMLYSIFQSLAIVYNSKSSNTMIFSSLFFTIILFFFILIMEFGPNPFKDNESLFIQVISQKIIVFSILIYFYIQVREILKITR